MSRDLEKKIRNLLNSYFDNAYMAGEHGIPASKHNLTEIYLKWIIEVVEGVDIKDSA